MTNDTTERSARGVSLDPLVGPLRPVGDDVVADDAALMIEPALAVPRQAAGSGTETERDSPKAVEDRVALDDRVLRIRPEQHRRSGRPAGGLGAANAFECAVAHRPPFAGEDVDAVGIVAWRVIAVLERRARDDAVV